LVTINICAYVKMRIMEAGIEAALYIYYRLFFGHDSFSS